MIVYCTYLTLQTKVPDPFDTELPNITLEDIENLKREVPEIAHLLV